MPAQNALERILAGSSESNDYSLDEMLNDDEDVFLENMSDESKNALYGRVTPKKTEEEKLEETQELPIQQVKEEQSKVEEVEKEEVKEAVKEVQPEPEQKRGRGRPRKESTEMEQQKTDVSIILDALCMSVIDDLAKEGYTFMNFTEEQTLVILNYMKDKLGE